MATIVVAFHLSTQRHLELTLQDVKLVFDHEWGAKVSSFFVFLDDINHASDELALITSTLTPAAIVLISDSIIDIRGELTDSAQALLKDCYNRRTILSIIAVHADADQHPRYVDGVVRTCQGNDGNTFLEELREELLGALNAIHYKLPPKKAPIGDGTAVIVHPVETLEELRQIFKLRFDSYSALRYIVGEQLTTRNGIEMDAYDQSALHFVAVRSSDGKVVGCVRLIVVGRLPNGHTKLLSSPASHISHCGEWASKIAEEEESPRLLRCLQNALRPLPIQNTFEFSDAWLRSNHPIDRVCQLSRVIVSPEFRGMGISKMLVRTGIACAEDLGRKCIVLDCSPIHAAMYTNYGFSVISDAEATTLGSHKSLNTLSVPMELKLATGTTELELRRSRKILDLHALGIREKSGIARTACLCDLVKCHENCDFTRHSQSDCPLTIEVDSTQAKEYV